MPEAIHVKLPDGTQKAAPRGTRIADFVKSEIGAGLAKAAVLARFNGKDVDLSTPLTEDGTLEVLTTKAPEALETIRHDAAHVVASVVQRLFPGTQVTIGPTIEDGFYYDFSRDTPFTPEDLARIEQAANEELQKDLPFVRTEVTADEAIRLFAGKGETFKVEIIQDIVAKGAKTLSLYSHGDWVDFCLGPHGPSTGKIGVIKLLSSSGAYWRGDHRNPMLQRIYGTAFFDRKALQEWLTRQEEARKRDHRKLGKELDLFHFHPYSPGAALWTPKGTVLYQLLANRMLAWTTADGYQEVKTPFLYSKALWELSGHWGKYRDNMFLVLDTETGEHDFGLKPMNCPSHYLLYGFKKHSYRELPLRFSTQDALHRNEVSGSLGGLTRVRQFSTDDAHIFCTEAQIGSEVQRFIQLLDRVYSAFGLTYVAKMGTRPVQRLGDDALWDEVEGQLRAVLDKLGVKYSENPGGGAFYGPKLDFEVIDSIGRAWQLGTVQLDYIASERFGLTYVGEDNAEHAPVVLHRAIYGSIERFIAILIEHYAGAFPSWLAPVQVAVVTVADRHLPWGRKVLERVRAAGHRGELDERGMTLNAKIREAQLQKIPFTLVIGDREVDAQGVAPRRYGGEDLKTIGLDAFLALLGREGAPPA
jgi:threonyl-tRNA synthetase